MRKNVKNIIIFGMLGFLLVGCASGPAQIVVEPAIDHDALARDGIAPHIWEEPMVDVIDVPPGTDPEGHYYRPAHQEVVEIRQGRWQYYKDKK
jgi:hypothetical protein